MQTPLTLLLVVTGVLAISAAACSRDAPEADTLTVARDPDTPISVDLRARARLVRGPLPRSRAGLLAYVGTDGNLYVVDPATGSTAQVTDDGSSAGTERGIFHAGMAWSRTGELAFARTDRETSRSALFVTRPGSGKTTSIAEGGQLIYASWSPATCEALACSRLAVIRDADGRPGGGVALKVHGFATSSAGEPVLEDEASQIYFAWSERGDRIVRHLLQRRQSLDEVDIERGLTRRLEVSPGPFFAPSFSRGRLVYALADGDGDELAVSISAKAVVVHVSRDARRVAFAPSPDGLRLAVAVRRGPQETPEAAFDPVRIVDLASGEITAGGPTTLWTKAFYWSPDGKRLAYLTWIDSDVSAFNQWRIFDVRDATDTGLAAFQPTAAFGTLTAFFDQFSQSHSLWSPDGRYLAYAAIRAGKPQVWLLDTRARPSRRVLIADGVAAAFSWR